MSGVDDPRHTLVPDGALDLPDPITDRYEELGVLGEGAMGVVLRVRDRALDRVVAMKVLRPALAAHPSAQARFDEEARVGGQLQHPGAVPVHEIGTLPDGRRYFTMREVRGRTFTAAIEATHGSVDFPRGLRRLVEALRDVCETVAYAHARGVVHRDLKPDNVLLGDFGEVLVIDWGVAKAGSLPSDEPLVSVRGSGSLRTRDGAVAGTPAYMAPEQAEGRLADIDARSDVFALGRMLGQVLDGAVTGVDPRGDAPSALRETVARATSARPADRFQDAAQLAAELQAWLEGARSREAALELVEEAAAATPGIARLRGRAQALRAEGTALLGPIAAWEPEGRKAPGWALQDRADVLDAGADRLEADREALLRGALTRAPDLAEAHVLLLAVHQRRHREAERARDSAATAREARMLRLHAEALPSDHPERAAWLAGLTAKGRLVLRTDVRPSEVILERFVLRNRRLVGVPVRALGSLPAAGIEVEPGSYLFRVRTSGRPEVRVPAVVGRGEVWDGGVIPVPAELGADEVYVPAGQAWLGGDPRLSGEFTLPGGRVPVAGFVCERTPVTNRAWMAFLDDLVARGEVERALSHAPRERAAEGAGAQVYAFDGVRFALRPDADGDVWDPEMPVVLVDHADARAYAAWRAARDGLPWRLPTEIEREKAARGVDGRSWPWGERFDPSWCCMRASHVGRPTPVSVESYPTDVSVYGVRGVAGNVREWTDTPVRDLHVVRGGSWGLPEANSRCGLRFLLRRDVRYGDLGVRLVRSWPSDVPAG